MKAAEMAARLEDAARMETAALPLLEIEAARGNEWAAEAIPHVKSQAEAMALAALLARQLASAPGLSLGLTPELCRRLGVEVEP